MYETSIIELKNSDIYQKDYLVLSDVNFTVNKGEFVYLIGRVGSGKTSVMRTLYADLELKKGDGIVSGYNLNRIKNKQIPYLRRKLGIVFQDFQLLTDRTIYENLSFVLRSTGWHKKSDIDSKITNVLEKVGLYDKMYKMPHELSGGEQQRTVIARAVLNDPEIILADEPTGNLDPETSEGIMKLLFEIKDSGKAVVMATHNYILLKKFPSRTYKCIDGKLIEHDEENHTIDFESLINYESYYEHSG
ncbi:MAG: ATP-binding cassette domain-containing protein [Bacteroidia bacterium]|nr:ATP-binding cassette domain-containing protein [Bacteroidia bacterium]